MFHSKVKVHTIPSLAFHERGLEQGKMIGKGNPGKVLTEDEIRTIIAQVADEMAVDGKAVLAIVPDLTRTCPLPMIARALKEFVGKRASKLDFLIALGTHPEMSDEQIAKLFGTSPGKWAETFGNSNVFNHQWKNPDSLVELGKLSADEVEQISGGLFRMDVRVTVNRLIFDYDKVLIIGPVFPHEVVGFSGGNKYFFPGICGEELLNFFHWLGAVITNPKIIGTKQTPVRATIDRAAEMIKVDNSALCMVTSKEGVHGLYFGDVKQAWSAAADLSAKIHIKYVDKPFNCVLARAPEMYDDIWTAGKCMYKAECIVADGGELIIYAPHVTEISYTHGKIIDEIGYHTRDYFLKQWDKFKDYPWGVLAHSTHVRGIGTYEDGVENCRINVTLATGIDPERCRKVNLGYRDPASINPADWQDRQEQGRFYIARAGETLYKLKNPPDWQRFE